jgi:hypothetical protein
MIDPLTSSPTTDLASFLTLLSDRLAAPPALLTRESFAALLDVGVSTFDRLRETRKIGPRPIHLAGLKWHREEVQAWLVHRGRNGELHDAETWPPVWESIQRKA